MTTVFLSPVFGAGAQLLNNSGVPLGGGKITVYLAGTTTLANTYTTAQGNVLNTNPLILDAGGRPVNEIWLPAGSSYKFVVTDSNDVAVGYTWDSIVGVNDATYPYYVASEWNLGSTPSYISATQFSVTGNQVSLYQQYRRVRTTNTGGIAYSTISASSYAAGITTVTVVNDSTPLDTGLTSLYYSLLSATPSSLPATVAVASYGAGGVDNIGLGAGAMTNLTGSYCVAIGGQAMNAATTASYNTAIGDQAMSLGVMTVTGIYNVAVGYRAVNSTSTGSKNIGIGASAVANNTIGVGNVGIGFQALNISVGTNYNTAVGDSALQICLGGTGNTAIGALSGTSGTQLFSDYNIYVGYGAVNLTNTDTNSITIGYNAVSKGSNTVYIGNATITDTYLSGRIRIPQYTTAGAPAYVKGALYFDTTLNKLRVGGASAWETVTSV